MHKNGKKKKLEKKGAEKSVMKDRNNVIFSQNDREINIQKIKCIKQNITRIQIN